MSDRDTFKGNTLVTGLRPEVAEFAEAMEQKLRKNDHKTGWHDQPIEAHIKLLRIEMMELDVALDYLGDEAAMKECVDVGNFAMIIRDKLLARIAAKTLPSGTPRTEFVALCDTCPDKAACTERGQCWQSVLEKRR